VLSKKEGHSNERKLKDTMNGKICLVTGATNGIGKATALALAQMGATVVIVGLTPEQGAQTSVYLASSLEVENVSGKYWEKRKVVPSGRAAYDEASWTRLWEVSDKMVAARATAG
jgi:NAD(P)-dependent dehydrogenase (short-subunit alcohol dehydrogenase family)